MIAVPDIHVSTAEAYAGVTPHPPDDATGERGIAESGGKRLAAAFVSTDPAVWRRDLVNDFEASVFERYPAVAELKQALINTGALYASMSGSGSAVFGIFQTRGQAEAAEEQLRRIEGTRVRRARALT